MGSHFMLAVLFIVLVYFFASLSDFIRSVRRYRAAKRELREMEKRETWRA